MNRITPNYSYEEKPCSVVALGCALNSFNIDPKEAESVEFDQDGYCSLSKMRKAVNDKFVTKYRYFKKTERMSLRQWIENLVVLDGKKAIVCVLGHYIFVEDGKYYSFFNNDSDEVVALWIIEGLRR